jgi:hypothetical protein
MHVTHCTLRIYQRKYKKKTRNVKKVINAVVHHVNAFLSDLCHVTSSLVKKLKKSLAAAAASALAANCHIHTRVFTSPQQPSRVPSQLHLFAVLLLFSETPQQQQQPLTRQRK